MGAKIINDKDFWVCKGGLMPAPLQSTQLVSKKKDGTRYIIEADKATQSFVDFACKKLMWLMALIAAIIAVAVVATGGAALIAICAVAGAAGAVVGAVMGSLICGQKAAMARKWLANKSNLKILNINTITGDHKMFCPIFGEEISYAPNIKSWWQAIAVGSANFIGEVLQGAMIGASVGMGGALFKGGLAAFGNAGFAGLGRAGLTALRSLPKNFVVNIAESFGKFGLGLRGVMGAQNTLGTYGNTGSASAGDFASGVFAMETGMVQSTQNIFTGQGTTMDFLGMALAFSPVGQGVRRPGADDAGAPRPEVEPVRDTDSSSQDGEAPTQDAEPVQDGDDGTVRQDGEAPPPDNTQRDGEAFEDPAALLDTATLGQMGEASVIAKLIEDGYTEVLQVQNRSGHGVDVIARNPLTGNVKAIEVKANTSQLSDAQKLGGESFVSSRLDRAATGAPHYRIPPNPESMRTDAQTAQRWIEDADVVDYEVHRVPIDRETGVVGDADVSSWDPPPED